MGINQSVQEGISVVQKLSDTVIDYLVKYGFQVLGGIVIILVGMWLANWVTKFLFDTCRKRQMDITLASLTIGIVAFLVTTVGFLLGRKAHHLIGKRAEVIGGLILIGIGIKIVLEHVL